jgi:hypothetical protein
MVKISGTQHMSKTGLYALVSTSLVKMASLFKVSFIWGSYAALFSASSIVMPLTGAFGGLVGTLAVCGVGLSGKLLLSGFISFKYLAYHIPGFFAALYWATPSVFVRLIMPLSCMLLFVLHPVGGAAWLYSMYWFIPVVLYFVPRQNLFLTALGSTFVAHAVGSTIWLYADPVSPVFWLALIPVVALERLVFASGMVIGHKMVTYLTHRLSSQNKQTHVLPQIEI